MPSSLATIQGFIWDESAQRYRSAATGRFVSQHSIKQAINTLVRRSQSEIRSLATQAANGSLDLAEFQTRMESELKNLHLSTATAARGGWDQMRPEDLGRVGAKLRFQYQRLEHFVRHIEAGDLSEKQIAARAEMYVGAANATFEETRRAGAEDAGFAEERNILGDAEHCSECLEVTAMGWQPINTLPAPGSRICVSNCRCSLEYR